MATGKSDNGSRFACEAVCNASTSKEHFGSAWLSQWREENRNRANDGSSKSERSAEVETQQDGLCLFDAKTTGALPWLSVSSGYVSQMQTP